MPETTQQALVRLIGDAFAEAQDGNLAAAMDLVLAARAIWEEAGSPEDGGEETD